MKFAIIGREFQEIKNEITDKTFEYSKKNPDFVICYGGDGIFLIGERIYPGIPKILVKGSPTSNKAQDIPISVVLEKFNNKEYDIQYINKLKAVYCGAFETRNLIGVNDIVIRNSLPTEALRFSVKTKGVSEEFIGDGVVVSTNYGSSKGAYFYSITRKEFSDGIGIAFNNVTKEKKEEIIPETEKIEVKVTRGPGVLVADNNRDYINLVNGDKVKIFQTKEVAKRLILK